MKDVRPSKVSLLIFRSKNYSAEMFALVLALADV